MTPISNRILRARSSSQALYLSQAHFSRLSERMSLPELYRLDESRIEAARTRLFRREQERFHKLLRASQFFPEG